MLVAGIVATCLVTFGVVSKTEPIYWAQVDAVFVGPSTPEYPNSLQYSSDSLIAAAGIVERLVNDGNESIKTASPTITMVDKGIYRGTSISLPSTGGQWSYSFDRPVLDIQAADGSPEAVERRLQAAISRVRTVLAQQQRNAGVEASQMIRVEASPEGASIIAMHGFPGRAIAVSLALGLALTVAVVVTVDTRRPRKMPRQQRIMEEVGAT